MENEINHEMETGIIGSFIGARVLGLYWDYIGIMQKNGNYYNGVIQGLGNRVLRFGVQGLGFRVQGLHREI